MSVLIVPHHVSAPMRTKDNRQLLLDIFTLFHLPLSTFSPVAGIAANIAPPVVRAHRNTHHCLLVLRRSSLLLAVSPGNLSSHRCSGPVSQRCWRYVHCTILFWFLVLFNSAAVGAWYLVRSCQPNPSRDVVPIAVGGAHS